MWDALHKLFDKTPATPLWSLTLQFKSYKMAPNIKMVEHLCKMSKMIRNFKAAGNNLTNVQQVLAMLRSLLEYWESIKIMITHNDTMKTFSHLNHHLELEGERYITASNDDAAILVAKPKTFKSCPNKNKGKGKAPFNKVKDNQEKG